MNPVTGTSSIGQEPTMAQSNGYENWNSVSPYSHSPYAASPMNEYGGFNFMPPPPGLPSESINRMPPPLPQPQHHQMIQTGAGPPPPTLPPTTMTHQHLPMLNTAWPSQLTNPSPSAFSAPPPSLTPVTPATADKPRPVMPTLPPPHQQQPQQQPMLQNDKARKTLSSEQKRAMCQYHEDNPGTRQADIGARFGVERSTVSKVLRHKDQYLKREGDVDANALKRAKAKHPDFDRTLSNYVRRQQQRGFDVKDDEIMEQAKLFARASGTTQDSLLSMINSNWLNKFKQKHGIGSGRLMRRASETNIPDSARMSTSVRGFKRDRAASGISPSSPSGQLSPLSGSRSDEDLQADGLDFFTYRHEGSHSATSLASDLREGQNSSFSGSTMSPTGPFTFSPDPNSGAFPVDQGLHLRSSIPDFHQVREKRSNTFPSLNIDPFNQPSKVDPATPRHVPIASAASSALESPAHELKASPFHIDTTLTSPPTLHRSGSNSSLNRSAGGSGMSLDSSPISPSQEDARRAANTLLNYIQSMSSNGQFDHMEYQMIVQLTKKLQIHHSSRPSIGGLSRIPEGDTEMMPPPTEVAMQAD